MQSGELNKAIQSADLDGDTGATGRLRPSQQAGNGNIKFVSLKFGLVCVFFPFFSSNIFNKWAKLLMFSFKHFFLINCMKEADWRTLLCSSYCEIFTTWSCYTIPSRFKTAPTVRVNVLEMGTFWSKNSLASGTVNFPYLEAKITKIWVQD